jgi:2-keto-4-pentenoate hydratase
MVKREAMTQQIKLSAGLIAELADRRQQGRVGPLLAQRPSNLYEAFATQQAVATLFASPVVGWKCGMPSSERWVLASLFQTELQSGKQCKIWPNANGLARVEPELCFVLKQPLPARVLPYTPEEIDQAIGSTHLALELIQSRYAVDAGAEFLDQLADGLFNQGMWLGPPIVGPELAEFTLRFVLDDKPMSDGSAVAIAAKHPNQAPRLPLYWLVNFLSSHQIDLTKGQMLITGSYAGVLEFPLQRSVSMQFGELGQCDFTFSPRHSF